MTKKTFAGISILLVAAICAYYWYQWRTLHGFVTAMDHGDDLFGDLTAFYYPMAQNIFSAKLPVDGYYYSAFFALLISPLGTVSIAQAKLLWGIAQVIFTGLLGIVSGAKLLELSRAGKVFFILLFLTSFPLLHNFKWGQISVLITLCVLSAIWLYKNEYYILSGILLAFAVSIKYYPIIFIVYPLLKRDYRFLIAFSLSVLTFFAVIPSIALGPVEWIHFEKAVSILISDAKFAEDVNSQYFGHVILRAFPLEDAPFKKKILSLILQGLGGFALLVNIGLIWTIQKRHAQNALALSVSLLFLSLPFIIQTSWPHYFVYLPFCQAAALVQIMQFQKTGKGFKLTLALTSLSCMASSLFAFNLFPGWSDYNKIGMLFISNFLLLLAFYQILWIKHKSNEQLHQVENTGKN